MFDTLSEKFDSAFKTLRGKAQISESNIEEAVATVKTALLEADVNFKVVKDFVAQVKEKALGEKVLKGVNPDQQFIKIVQEELARIMGDKNEELDLDRDSLIPILIVGLNGQGKTTFTGKFSKYLKEKKNKNVYLIPADNFRPAAKDQLITLANQVGVDYFDSDLSLHPKEIVRLGLIEAKKQNRQIVLIDTAGRLHVDTELMGQIKEVKNELLSNKPEVLLVADAMTGQEAVNVAKSFHELIGLTGIVLSKMDSDAKGGAALSIKHSTGVPIRYISMGEKMKDLELFHPDRLAGRILDMGDVVTLVEKAQEQIDEKEAQDMMKRMEKNQFSVDDFMKQMEMMSNLGSMGSILKMIPGMGGMMRQIGDLSPAEAEMKRMKVIIQSMTKEERKNYKVIKESRMNRIAKGSGNTIQAVKDFLAKFKQMEQMMGGMMQMMKGGMPGMPGMGGGMGGNPNLPPRKKPRSTKGPWGGGFF
jgi:signal recognition particle subunit SRP54